MKRTFWENYNEYYPDTKEKNKGYYLEFPSGVNELCISLTADDDEEAMAMVDRLIEEKHDLFLHQFNDEGIILEPTYDDAEYWYYRPCVGEYETIPYDALCETNCGYLAAWERCRKTM